jgi:hypothetical protein
MLSDFFLFLSFAGLCLLLLSYFTGGKRVVVEMLVVFQLAFISLASAPMVTPMLSSVATLGTCNNGYNILGALAGRPFDDPMTDQRTKGMQLYSQFLYNLNTGMLLVVLPLVIGGIALIIGAICQWKGAKTVGRYALGEYTFIGLLFTGCITGGGLVIQLKWGMAEMQSLLGMFSLAAALSLITLYPAYLILRVKIPQCFP